MASDVIDLIVEDDQEEENNNMEIIARHHRNPPSPFIFCPCAHCKYGVLPEDKTIPPLWDMPPGFNRYPLTKLKLGNSYQTVKVPIYDMTARQGIISCLKMSLNSTLCEHLHNARRDGDGKGLMLEIDRDPIPSLLPNWQICIRDVKYPTCFEVVLVWDRQFDVENPGYIFYNDRLTWEVTMAAAWLLERSEEWTTMRACGDFEGARNVIYTHARKWRDQHHQAWPLFMKRLERLENFRPGRVGF